MSYGTCPCGAALSPENASRLPDGRVVHIGCAGPVTSPQAPANAPPAKPRRTLSLKAPPPPSTENRFSVPYSGPASDTEQAEGLAKLVSERAAEHREDVVLHALDVAGGANALGVESPAVVKGARVAAVLAGSPKAEVPFRAWLADCFGTGFGSAPKLVDGVIEAVKGGHSTDVAIELLRAAVADGWVTRCAKEDRGTNLPRMRKAGYAVTPDLCHGYEPVRGGGREWGTAGVEEFLGGAKLHLDETMFTKPRPVCPRCLGVEPGKPAGDPAKPHPGPFTSELCSACDVALITPKRAAEKAATARLAARVVGISSARPHDEVVDPPPLGPDPIEALRRSQDASAKADPGATTSRPGRRVLAARRPVGGIHPKQRERLVAKVAQSKATESDPVKAHEAALETLEIEEADLDAAIESKEERESAAKAKLRRDKEQRALAADPPKFGAFGGGPSGVVDVVPERPPGTKVHVFDARSFGSTDRERARCGEALKVGSDAVEWTILRSDGKSPVEVCAACEEYKEDRWRSTYPAIVRPDQFHPFAPPCSPLPEARPPLVRGKRAGRK